MKRILVLIGVPFLVLGLILLGVSLASAPMITLVSNEQQEIQGSPAADQYYYLYWPIGLSASQRVEFQFSATRPLDFVILDSQNFDRFLQNETFVAIVTSLAESQNTHSFTPVKTDTFYFFLQNTSTQDATATVTIRTAFTGLPYVGAGIMGLGAILMIIGFLLKPKAADMPSRVLEMIMMHGRITINELALRFSTSPADIEMAILKLRSMGQPILYDRATGEVSYGPPPRPPETQPSPAG